LLTALFFCFFAIVACSQTGSDPCSAIQVHIDGSVGNATLYGSTAPQQSSTAPSRCVPSPSSGVVWYTVTPEAGKNVVVATCGAYTNFDTFIGVHKGTCEQLTCMISNEDGHCPSSSISSWTTFSSFEDDYSKDGFYPDPSSAQWIADGSQYFIAVSGNRKEYGNFDFTVSVGESLSGCPTAKEIQGPYTSGPVVVNGTMRVDETVGLPTCHQFHYDTPAVWFKIFPELNKNMNVTTCNPATTFDTRMAILSGSCSDSLECLWENDDDSCHVVYESSTINFFPTLSEYFVIVTGFSSFREGENFGLVLSQEQNAAIPNCVYSIPLRVGISGNPQGSTAMLGSESTSPLCNEQGMAVWFDVESYVDSTVTFSTCNEYTDFNTVLSVYGGSCDSLFCMNTVNTPCTDGSMGSSVTVQLQANVHVHLVLSGENGATGNFELFVSSA